jgi:AraC-like DNA-binding protein
MEQRCCIKFCQNLGDSKVETIRKIQQAFGDDAMGATQIKSWFNRFKDGLTLADNGQHSGRPSTSLNANVIENVRSLIPEDRRLTIREIADEVGISTDSAHSILTEDLHMCIVVARFVPKLLLQEQQQLRLEVARDMLECANGHPEFLKIVIMVMRCGCTNMTRKRRCSCHSGSILHPQGPKKAQRVRSKVKVLLTVFVEYRGIVHHSYAPGGQTINKKYYLSSS